MIKVLNQNKIDFNSKKLEYQSDKIMIFILALLHSATFNLDNVSEVKCNVVGIQRRYVEGGVMTKNLSIGIYLPSGQMFGNTSIPFGLTVFNVVETDLPSAEWCEDDLFDNIGTETRDLEVSENFKLTSIQPHEGPKILDMNFSDFLDK